MDIQKIKVTEGGWTDFSVFSCETENDISPKALRKITKKNTEKLTELQDRFYAEGKVALLVIFQAMDAAGKDSAIKHVMSGVDPQGVNVHSFKQPSKEELAHDYMWRAVKVLPERGKIAIFNRSYYEDVLIVKVRKLYENYNMPDRCKTGDTIEQRYKQIRDFEDYLWENGIITVKFFLHLSKDEQRKRFLKRIDRKDKNWKFSETDLEERKLWDDYQEAYQTAIRETATEKNPWYIVSADKKPLTRAVISEVLVDVMNSIDPQYPKVTAEMEAGLLECKKRLLEEE